MAPAPNYTDVAVEQREDLQDDASMEAGASLMGHDAKEWSGAEPHSRRGSRTRRICAGLAFWRWILDTALLLVILGLLLERRWHGWEGKDGNDTYELAGDLTGFAPRCRTPSPRTGGHVADPSSLAANSIVQARQYLRSKDPG